MLYGYDVLPIRTVSGNLQRPACLFDDIRVDDDSSKGPSRNDVTLGLHNKADTSPLPLITFCHFLADPPPPKKVTSFLDSP